MYDQVGLVALAIAKTGTASGQAVHDSVRTISQGSGQVVTNAVEGLKLIASGKAVNYDGASGPCDFLPTGDIATCKFRFEQADAGKYKLLSVS